LSVQINKFALKAALRDLDEQGIDIGTVVTVTWTVPANYATEGATTRSQTGPLKYLDRAKGFYEIAPTIKSPGHYRGYLLSQTSNLTKAVNQAKPNPFIDKATKPVNPFLKGKAQ